MNSKRRGQSNFPRVEPLESRTLLAAPVLDPLSALGVPARKSLIVPLTAADADGNPLTYTVTSSNPAIKPTILNAGVDLKFTVAGYGDMIFQLLPEYAPTTVSKIAALVNSNFYNGLTFHRVVPNFVIQGGDPNGDGTGGPGFQFDDEFNTKAIFSGDGQLAMANSGRDTNGSQFFVTVGPQRLLDFNHAIFGQLVRGFDVLRAINVAPGSASANNRPSPPIVITSATMVADTADSVLHLEAASTGSATITVTVNDGQGGTDSKSFLATAAPDSIDDPPILGPVTNQVTATNTPIAIPLTSLDLQNGPVTYAADVLDFPAHATVIATAFGVTVTPEAGFQGIIRLKAQVKRTGATSRGSSNKLFDEQPLTVTVKDQIIEALGANLTGVEGTAITGATVATFTATVPYAASAFSASIAWGDGTTTSGIVTRAADGSYVVAATKTYDRTGSYAASVTITDTLSKRSRNATFAAAISDAPLSPTFIALAPVAGTASFSGTIAIFADTNPKSNLADFSASIDWGDGSTTTGAITRAVDGTYAVIGSKTYAGIGSYPVRVTINDVAATTVAEGRLTVPNRAPTLDPIGVQAIAEGTTLYVQATARDADSGQQVTYSLAPGSAAGATIDPATGVVQFTPATGPASPTITVVATDNGTPAMTASATFVVNVTDVAPTVDAGQAAAIRQFDTFASAGRFTDPGLGPWTATVDYGDGSGRRPLALAADRSFSLSHAYPSAGQFRADVLVTDAGGQTGASSVAVSVAEIPAVRVLRAAARLNKKKQIIGVDLGTDGAIDGTTAGKLANFVILAPGRDKLFGTRDDLVTRFASATYNRSTATISLTLSKALKPRGPLQLRASGLQDTFGRPVVSVSGGSIAASIGKSDVTLLATRRN